MRYPLFLSIFLESEIIEYIRHGMWKNKRTWNSKWEENEAKKEEKTWNLTDLRNLEPKIWHLKKNSAYPPCGNKSIKSRLEPNMKSHHLTKGKGLRYNPIWYQVTLFFYFLFGLGCPLHLFTAPHLKLHLGSPKLTSTK